MESLGTEKKDACRRQKRFFVWGDSLGAVLAYEFAKLWEAFNGVIQGLRSLGLGLGGLGFRVPTINFLPLL